jgi:hypothetical protein
MFVFVDLIQLSCMTMNVPQNVYTVLIIELQNNDICLNISKTSSISPSRLIQLGAGEV